MNTRTMDGGSEDKTFCSKIDLIKDVPFMTPCSEHCCNPKLYKQEFPVWWLSTLVVLFALVVISTFLLLN